jgi:hypothetical protein
MVRVGANACMARHVHHTHLELMRLLTSAKTATSRCPGKLSVGFGVVCQCMVVHDCEVSAVPFYPKAMCLELVLV